MSCSSMNWFPLVHEYDSKVYEDIYPISSPDKGYIPLVPVTFRKFMDILILPLVDEDLHLVGYNLSVLMASL